MPYIKPEDREKFYTPDGFQYAAIRDEAHRCSSVGDLNYLITSLVDEYVYKNGLSYTTLNAAIGVLECCKLEMYRRVASVYEDSKKEANGCVYRTVSKAKEASGNDGRRGATPNGVAKPQEG